MHRSRAAVLSVGVLSAILGSPEAAVAATKGVEIHDYHYRPHRVLIAPGDRVEWENTGDEDHTVTSDDPDAEDFDSGDLGDGETYDHIFDDEGTYRYHCEIHDGMSGVVEVVDPDATTTSSSTTTSTTTTTTTSTTTSTTAPVPPATSAPAPTTTTTRPRPATTRPPATATTTTPPASVPSPPPEAAAGADPPETTSTSVSTTTTTVAPTTTTGAPAPPEASAALGPEVPTSSPPADGSPEIIQRQDAAARSEPSGGDGVGARELLLMAALLGSVAFGGWTLWKLRPLRD